MEGSGFRVQGSGVRSFFLGGGGGGGGGGGVGGVAWVGGLLWIWDLGFRVLVRGVRGYK